jgi:ribonucleoside-diphosphate reductase alpha chain
MLLPTARYDTAMPTTSPAPAQPAVSAPVDPLLGDGSQRRIKADLCPECGDAALVYEEGCAKCHSCGYSEC